MELDETTKVLDRKTQAYVKAALRSASLKSPQRKAALDSACIGEKLNVSSGRMAKHYKCAHCNHNYPLKRVQVDHLSPIVPLSGWDSWDGLINRLFLSEMQVLCIECHKAKSKQEAMERKQHAN